MRRLLVIAASLWLGVCPTSAITSGQYEVLFGNIPTPTCAAANTAIAAMPGVTPANTTLLKKAICPLVTSGTWAKLDAMWVFAVATDPASVINLVNPATFTITGHGVGASSMVFLPNYGWYGDGIGAYLNTGFTPSTAAGHFTENAGSIGVLVQNSNTTEAAVYEMGDSSSSASNTYILPRFTDGKAYVTVNNATGLGVANANRQGFWIADRTSSTVLTEYLNGTSITSGNPSAPVALSANVMVICAGYSGSSTIGGFSADTIGGAFIGGGLTQADVTALNTAFQLFKAVGTIPNYYAAWGYSVVFNDTFSGGLADIDYTNTLNAGYNWYVSPYFGSVVPASGDFTYSSPDVIITASTEATNYRSRLHTRGNYTSNFTGTISGTTLTASSVATSPSVPITPGQYVDGSGVTGCSVLPTGCPKILAYGTAGTTGTGGSGTYALSASGGTISSGEDMSGFGSIGTLPPFSPGGYYEACFSFNPAAAPALGTGGWQAFWLEDLQVEWTQNLTAGFSNPSKGMELDVFESIPTASPGSPTSNFDTQDWTNTQGGGFGTQNKKDYTGLTGTLTNQNCYGVLWIPTWKNGGTGWIQRFFNGVKLNADVTYHINAVASPAFTPSNPVGVLSSSESPTAMFNLMIEGGYSDTINITSVKVAH